MSKQEVNYKIISGMRAVGNQCKDCKHNSGTVNWCKKIEQWVNGRAHCDCFDAKEQDAK